MDSHEHHCQHGFSFIFLLASSILVCHVSLFCITNLQYFEIVTVRSLSSFSIVIVLCLVFTVVLGLK